MPSASMPGLTIARPRLWFSAFGFQAQLFGLAGDLIDRAGTTHKLRGFLNGVAVPNGGLEVICVHLRPGRPVIDVCAPGPSHAIADGGIDHRAVITRLRRK